MRKEIVTRVCDLPHQVGQPDEPARPFELYVKGAGRYTVDLCEMHASYIVNPILKNGRRVQSRKAPTISLGR